MQARIKPDSIHNAANLYSEKGSCFRIGYVVQVRKKAGAFGCHIILLRHPDGTLASHVNETFYRIAGEWQDMVLNALVNPRE